MLMKHVVQPGDTLWRLAARYFGDPEKWRVIQQDNPTVAPRQLIIGDELVIRDAALASRGDTVVPAHTAPSSAAEQRPSLVPGRAFLFVLADEIDPLSRKLVRRVIVNPRVAERWAAQLGRPVPYVPHPESFGFAPTDMNSLVTPGRHAQGLKPSSFTSASDHLLGASRFSGSPFWIDVGKARAAGATIHETQEILGDLDKIIARTRNVDKVGRLNRVRQLVAADAEVLIRGPIPAAAVKGTSAMLLTRALQGAQIVGFVMTAVDIGTAANTSLRTSSVKPLAAEGIRQAGGWAAAWAGVKLGAAAGAAVGIETGPGAVVTGAVGGIAGGVAGYCGFDWVADFIYEN